MAVTRRVSCSLRCCRRRESARRETNSEKGRERVGVEVKAGATKKPEKAKVKTRTKSEHDCESRVRIRVRVVEPGAEDTSSRDS
eukprot:2963767-Rhodomonas_salina.6